MNWLTWFGGLFFGLGIGFGINAWRSRRTLRRLEQAASAIDRAGRAVAAPIMSSIGLASDLLGIVDSMSNMTQSLGEIAVAMANCWDQAMVLVDDGRYYDAAKAIGADPRVITFSGHRNLIQTLYRLAVKKGSDDAELIRRGFPFVSETLKPIPVPLPLKTPQGRPMS